FDAPLDHRALHSFPTRRSSDLGIRQTYEAVIHAPAGMRAVMSAEHAGADNEQDPQGNAVFRFRMDKRIPPYLIALAVGDLAFRPDRKSTRLNSSHGSISYAVFC